MNVSEFVYLPNRPTCYIKSTVNGTGAYKSTNLFTFNSSTLIQNYAFWSSLTPTMFTIPIKGLYYINLFSHTVTITSQATLLYFILSGSAGSSTNVIYNQATTSSYMDYYNVINFTLTFNVGETFTITAYVAPGSGRSNDGTSCFNARARPAARISPEASPAIIRICFGGVPIFFDLCPKRP